MQIVSKWALCLLSIDPAILWKWDDIGESSSGGEQTVSIRARGTGPAAIDEAGSGRPADLAGPAG